MAYTFTDSSETQKRVLVAMSGGVDSSVAALLLKEAGYEVRGITMKLFDDAELFKNPASACCSQEDLDCARQVCEKLGVSHEVCHLEESFKENVIDRFCAGYLSGKTPNPCIDCNRYMKFGALQKKREELGFDYLATGHYAQRRFNEQTGRYELLKGKDAGKDQSYVLFHLSQDALKHMIFPLGELAKAQTRTLARDKSFLNADKAESQDICFVEGDDYASFIAQQTGHIFTPGNIVNRAGDVIGEHTGLEKYTIGQRKGIGVAAREPLYVFAKDISRNELIVDTDERTRCAGLEVNDVNFIERPSLASPESFTVKASYRQSPRPARVEQTDNHVIRIVFDTPQRACAPGQAAVVYHGESVVCGGTIVESFE